MSLIPLLWSYFRIRQLHFSQREKLEHWQAKKLSDFRQRVLSKSPWFRRYLSLPFEQWPLMDKALMMTHFDEMNTANLKSNSLISLALNSEQSRNFKPRLGEFSVGLSSGTSGSRGLFVVSPREQQIWAAGMLAKALPDGIFAKERVALFLRADNNLYQTVNSRWLSLVFYDLLGSFQQQLKRLEQQSPTLIVAPAQVLRALALAVTAGELRLNVKKVISVAEVLDEQDKQLLSTVFGRPGEIYQATEGFLAATCAYGTLHLNEEFIHIEPQWLDERRFIPIITDFTRTTQPIVRYRLNDILTERETPCACGSATRAIERIEGRQDDQLLLPALSKGSQSIFADPCSRVLAMSLPLTADYRLLQTDASQLHLIADCTPEILETCRRELEALFSSQGVNIKSLGWKLESSAPQTEFSAKRRRIIRQWRKA